MHLRFRRFRILWVRQVQLIPERMVVMCFNIRDRLIWFLRKSLNVFIISNLADDTTFDACLKTRFPVDESSIRVFKDTTFECVTQIIIEMSNSWHLFCIRLVRLL